MAVLRALTARISAAFGRMSSAVSRRSTSAASAFAAWKTTRTIRKHRSEGHLVIKTVIAAQGVFYQRGWYCTNCKRSWPLA